MSHETWELIIRILAGVAVGSLLSAIYNCIGMSSVGTSWELPISSAVPVFLLSIALCIFVAILL